MPGKVLEEPFDLTDQDSNITKSNATDSAWSDMYKYQVPVGIGHTIQPGHFISAYLDKAGTETSATALVKIEVRDSAEQDKRTVFGPAVYAKIKEFQDRNKIARLNVAEPVPVLERQWIVLMVSAATAPTTANSYFDLAISRIRRALI